MCNAAPVSFSRHQEPRCCGEFTRTSQVYHSERGHSPLKGSSSVKKYATLVSFLLLAMLVLAFTQPRSSTQAQSSAPAISQTPVVSPSERGPYVVTGKPTISVGFINRVLAASGSPASGKGQALYTLG